MPPRCCVTYGLALADRFEAAGPVDLHRARIGGSLTCSGGKFNGLGLVALQMYGIDVAGDALGRPVPSPGRSASAGRTSTARSRARTESSTTRAKVRLFTDNIDVKGSVLLDDDFVAHGEVRLLNAQIGNEVACRGGTFHNPGKIALHMDRVVVGGMLLLDEDFEALGEVRLINAQIGGQIACNGGKFDNPGDDALSMDNVIVKGSLDARPAIRGQWRGPPAGRANRWRFVLRRQPVFRWRICAVCQAAATRVAAFICRASRRRSTAPGPGQALDRTVSGDRRSELARKADARLAFGPGRHFARQQKSWPEAGNLRLEGLEYQEIASDSPAERGDAHLLAPPAAAVGGQRSPADAARSAVQIHSWLRCCASKGCTPTPGRY